MITRVGSECIDVVLRLMVQPAALIARCIGCAACIHTVDHKLSSSVPAICESVMYPSTWKSPKRGVGFYMNSRKPFVASNLREVA